MTLRVIDATPTHYLEVTIPTASGGRISVTTDERGEPFVISLTAPESRGFHTVSLALDSATTRSLIAALGSRP